MDSIFLPITNTQLVKQFSTHINFKSQSHYTLDYSLGLIIIAIINVDISQEIPTTATPAFPVLFTPFSCIFLHINFEITFSSSKKKSH